MCRGTFSYVVAANFQEIKKNFKSGLKNSGYMWDEDIFMDAYIKCDSVLKDKIMDKKEALKYYWTAYVNKLKNKYKSRYTIIDEIPEDYDVIDEVYNEDKDLLCEIIYNAVKDKFGKPVANAWIDYRCFGKTAEVIMKEYKLDHDFHYILKRIKKYINEELMENKYVQEIYDNTLEQ